MRITELMDKRSIEIGGRPKDKKEALDQMIALMLKRLRMKKHTADRYMRGRKRGQLELARGLQFLMGAVMR